jgi:D-xylose reductase
MTIPTLTLNTGDKLPAVGLGYWKVPRAEAAALTVEAIRCGYRHLDCACDYGNEAEVGAGIRQAIEAGLCRREDLWITSKLWNTYHTKTHVRQALEHSLRDLGVEYLDLYLIHFPISLRFIPFHMRYPPGWVFDPSSATPRMEATHVPLSETWSALEELVAAGVVRNIGVCNFNCALLRDLRSYAKIRPAVLQAELHPYLAQEKLLRYCHETHIAVTAFSPLAAESYVAIGMAEANESVLSEPAVQEIAANHQRTAAQVVLRWGIQRGTAIVPKTIHDDRLCENLNLFDFELTADELQAISALNRNRRFNDPGVFCESSFGTFFPIFD